MKSTSFCAVQSGAFQRTSLIVVLAIVGFLATGGSPCSATLLTLGHASNFAMLADLTTADSTSATKTASINLNNYTINGDLGAPTIKGAAPNHYNGNIYTANSSQPAGTLVGTYHPSSAATINTAAADAITFSNQIAALTTTQTVSGNLNGQTITGAGGVNVIDVTGGITGAFNVHGGANDIFVFNVHGTMNVTSGVIGGNNAGSTVTPSQIIYNFIGTTAGQTVKTMVPNTVNGTLLSVNGNYTFTLDSVANGQAINLFDGATAITGMSAQFQNGTGNFFRGVPVPEPSTIALGIAGFACLGFVAQRKRLRRA
ncbi:MAG TPA: collagen-binding domain-containing protein [Pirellulales bacterium]|jgi:hypothetical protein